MKHRIFIKPLILLIIIVVTYFITQYYGVKDYITREYIAYLFKNYTYLSIIIFINLFFITNFIQIPAFGLLVAAVLTLGKFKGGALTYFASLYGCSLVFITVRFFGAESMKAVNSKWMNRFIKKLNEHPIRYVFILRLIFQTSPALNYSLALTNLSFKEYFIGSSISLLLTISIMTSILDLIINYFWM